MRSKAELTALIHAQPRAVLVVNTRSRHAAGQRRRLPGGLGDAGVGLLATLPVGVTGDLASTLRKALLLEPDLLVVAGGDGTMGTAAGLLAHRDTALGVIPLGTMNNFARSLEVPLDVPAAVRTVAAGKVADVDLGRVDHAGGVQVFATLTSVGVSVEVARRTPHRLKRLIGPPAYAATALAVFPGHAPFQATVRTGDGRSESFFTHQLNVANGRFHAGRVIAADASIDDHQLVAYRLGGRGRPGLSVATLAHVVRGASRHLAGTAFLATSQVHLVTDPVLAVEVDGEVRARTPITVSTEAEALRVMVPPGFADT